MGFGEESGVQLSERGAILCYQKLPTHPNSSGQFSIKSANDALKGDGDQGLWAPVIWFTKNVPRWAFILWLCCLVTVCTVEYGC